MSKTLRFLTSQQVKTLHLRNVSETLPLLPTMLDSAVDSPINHNIHGQTDLLQLAATLAERVILNHAYPDGNKRTALVAADMFLKVNGYQLQRNPMEATDESLNRGLSEAHISVAKREWTSEKLAQYYESIATRVEINEEIQLYTKGARTLDEIQRQVERKDKFIEH